MRKRLVLYVCGRYEDRTVIHAFCQAWLSKDFDIRAHWLTETTSNDQSIYSNEERTQIALRDYAEVREADAILYFPDHAHPGTGRHRELGAAYAYGKPVICYGERGHTPFDYVGMVECKDLWKPNKLVSAIYDAVAFYRP